MSHNSTAKAIRLRKEERPELYCIHRECLHRAPCPKHMSESLQHQAFTQKGGVTILQFKDESQ